MTGYNEKSDSSETVEVGDGIVSERSSWRFDGTVPERFDQHVSRSIPGYHNGHDLVIEVIQNMPAELQGGLIYELGCSTGVLTEKIAQVSVNNTSSVIGIDQVEGMLEIARSRCSQYPNTDFYQGDLNDFDFTPASMMVSYYTLQFVPLAHRRDVIKSIYSALVPGGKLVLFEKICFADPEIDCRMNEAYADYKRQQGYTDAEIKSKALSLEGVLIPQTQQQNVEMLNDVGFQHIDIVFTELCWQGYIAQKIT